MVPGASFSRPTSEVVAKWWQTTSRERRSAGSPRRLTTRFDPAAARGIRTGMGSTMRMRGGLAAATHQAVCTAGAVLLVLVVAAASANGDQPNPVEPGEPPVVTVDVSGPVVVGFLWSMTQSGTESDKETIARVKSALDDVAKCLKNDNVNVSVRLEFTRFFRFRGGGSNRDSAQPSSLGGRHPWASRGKSADHLR